MQRSNHPNISLLIKIHHKSKQSTSNTMVKRYRRLTDDERKNLVDLIHKNGYTIKEASRQLNIPYPNAKAVNQTYILENRTAKKNFRLRVAFHNHHSPHMASAANHFTSFGSLGQADGIQ